MSSKFRIDEPVSDPVAVITLVNVGTHGVQIRVGEFLLATVASGGEIRLSEVHPNSSAGEYFKLVGFQLVKSSGAYVHVKVTP